MKKDDVGNGLRSRRCSLNAGPTDGTNMTLTARHHKEEARVIENERGRPSPGREKIEGECTTQLEHTPPYEYPP